MSSSLYEVHVCHPDADQNGQFTQEGKIQAREVQAWLKYNMPTAYMDKFCCSEHPCRILAEMLNAKEIWAEDDLFRRRNCGKLVDLSHSGHENKNAKYCKEKAEDFFIYTPHDGESWQDFIEACVYKGLELLDRSNEEKHVVCISHKDWIRGVEFVREDLTVEQLQQKMLSTDPHDEIHNGQVIMYSKICPETGVIVENYRWKKSVYPYNEDLSSNEWKKIRP